jgi:hypothetical protein
MKKLSAKKISDIIRKKELQNEILELEKKKNNMDFITRFEKKVSQAVASKNEANKKVKFLLKENQKLESEIDMINSVQKYRPKKIYISVKKNSGCQIITHSLWSDFHGEEVVKKEEMQGLNEYNFDICIKRFWNLIHKILKCIEIERYGASIDILEIDILGDLMSGYIHDELSQSNCKEPSDTMLALTDLLYSGICYLLEKGKFKKIIVLCMPGNHSRYTKGRFIHHKGFARKTFEWILFHNLAKLFDVTKRNKIEFIIPESSMYVKKTFGFDIRFQHGHNFKYNGGIGGASVSINRKILRWSKKQPVYLDVIGHGHEYETLRNCIRNGSLIGYNQFAMDCGFEFQEPIQALFGIHEKKGLVFNRPIYV